MYEFYHSRPALDINREINLLHWQKKLYNIAGNKFMNDF